VFISAARGDGLDDLLATLGERVAAARLIVDFEIPFDRGDVRSRLHEEGEVLKETFESDGYRLQVRTSQDVLARFSEFLVDGRGEPGPDGV
jgi:GTP-binding protein HflX